MEVFERQGSPHEKNVPQTKVFSLYDKITNRILIQAASTM